MSDNTDPEKIKAIFSQAASAQGAPAEGASPGEAPPEAAHSLDNPTLIALHGIHPQSWEHPADRAALNTLRSIPVLDQVVRKFFGFISERNIKLLYLANAVQVGPRQYHRVWRAYQQCLTVLDVTAAQGVPDLFISQSPIINAGAVGFDDPFIVLNSGVIDQLTDAELRFVIGHELGHIRSGHALYKTMLALFLSLPILRSNAVMAAASTSLILALREWSRKSELSADRAGLLCLQDPMGAYRVLMKTAGGAHSDQMDVHAFIEQAERYEREQGVRDGALKFLNLLQQTHPFPVLRLGTLKRWVDDGGYAQILAGQYARRGDPLPIFAPPATTTQGGEGGFELGALLQGLGSSLSEMGGALKEQLRTIFSRDTEGEEAAEGADGADGAGQPPEVRGADPEDPAQVLDVVAQIFRKASEGLPSGDGPADTPAQPTSSPEADPPADEPPETPDPGATPE